MKKIAVIITTIFLTAFTSVILTIYVIDTSETPEIYDVYNIDSEILSEKREIIVKKPANYKENTDRKYPVIYVFGGNTLTYSIAYDTELLTRTEHIQPVIVVGVSNISQKTRQRDLTPPFMKQDIDEQDSPLGKADIYLDFIKKEIIPLIDQKYRTSSNRLAVGHSREGLMVMYSLISKPNLFQGHIALSPALWRENNVFVRHFKEYLNKNDSIKSRLFLSMGEQEVDKMKKAFDFTIDILESDTTNKWKSMYTKDATHDNNALLSAPIGIEWILNNN